MILECLKDTAGTRIQFTSRNTPRVSRDRLKDTEGTGILLEEA